MQGKEENKMIHEMKLRPEYYNFILNGTKMIEESMKFLGTTKPFITLADYKLSMFQPFIDKYSWQLTEVIFGLYNNKSKELCFNGFLTKTNSNNKMKMKVKK